MASWLAKLLIIEVAITFLATAFTVFGYTWVLPHFFPGLRTYSVLVLGMCSGAILGGFAALAASSKTGNRRWFTAVFLSVLVALFTWLGVLAVLTKMFGS